MKIAIIGGGWYGSHLAASLSEDPNNHVVLFEKNPGIFTGISGKFGIRLHAGPHYPRSPETRKGCHRASDEFKRRYPELLNDHQYSIYALGKRDANGLPPKVTVEHFQRVCEESETCHKVDLDQYGYTNTHVAFNIEESSIVLGEQLRAKFQRYLKKPNIELRCSTEVSAIHGNQGQMVVTSGDQREEFNHVINTTSFKAFTTLGKSLSIEMNVVYQVCLALVYRDTKKPTADMRPFSVIWMDGWFPCIMPYDDREEKDDSPITKYIMTHGKWTVGSYKTATAAQCKLNSLDDACIEENIKPNCEEDITRFWAEFTTRFHYLGWVGSVLAKIKTEREFRGAVTYCNGSDIIQVIPGKVSNIFDVEREVKAIMADGYNLVRTPEGGRYLQGGVLDQAIGEITEEIVDKSRNTCELQTFDDMRELSSRQPADVQTENMISKFISLLYENKLAMNTVVLTMAVERLAMFGGILQNHQFNSIFMCTTTILCLCIVVAAAQSNKHANAAHTMWSKGKKLSTEKSTQYADVTQKVVTPAL